MDPAEKELLKRAVLLGEENNNMLRAIRRSLRFSRIMSILYWVFIIGSAIGAFYLIQPYVDTISSMYGGAKSSLGAGSSFQAFLDNFK
jgi:hypothetical protein